MGGIDDDDIDDDNTSTTVATTIDDDTSTTVATTIDDTSTTVANTIDDDTSTSTSSTSVPPPAAFTQSFSSAGGSITVTWNGSFLSLDAINPVAGFAAEIHDNDGTRVRVEFEPSGDGGDDARIEVRVEDGRFEVRVD